MKTWRWLVLLLLTGSTARGDWPTVHGGVARSGLVREELHPPIRLAWVRHFEGERLGSAAEPVVDAIEEVRHTLESSALAWKHGWSLEHVLDAIEEVLHADGTGPNWPCSTT